MRLRRCPFCGGDAAFEEIGGIITVANDTASTYIVKCERCGIHTREYSTQEEAAEQWNTRQEDNGIILVEDGSVDLDECKELGLRPLVYRKGAAIPLILKGDGK